MLVVCSCMLQKPEIRKHPQISRTRNSIKVSIHENFRHLFQMFPQISHTLNFGRRFLEKRCALPAAFYGNLLKPYLMRRLGMDFPKCWFAFEVYLKQTVSKLTVSPAFWWSKLKFSRGRLFATSFYKKSPLEKLWSPEAEHF